ncbi:MAG: tyrosine-type recombinase/integrase [Leucobacter sp.]
MGRAANGQGAAYKTADGWRGSILLNGRRRYVSGSTKTAVAEKLRALKRQSDEGFIQKGRSPKLAAWIDHWLTATEGKHAIKTHSDYQKIIRLYLPSWLGSIQLSKLEPENLEEAYSDLFKQKLSQSTVYQLHSIIRAALNLAVKRGHAPKNAAQLVVDPPQSKAVKKLEAFSRADQAAIKRTLVDSRSRARWELALGLGPRPGEVLGLETKHLNFDEGSILIEQQIQMIDRKLTLVPYTKSMSSRRKIPMPAYLAKLLRERLEERMIERGISGEKWEDWSPDGEPRAWLFTSARRPGRPITPSGDETQWSQILTKAGLPSSPRYRARHTAASEMIAAGLDITVVAEIMGHSIKVLQEVYAHAIEERKIAAASVLDFAHELAFGSIDAEIDAVKEKEPRTGQV